MKVRVNGEDRQFAHGSTLEDVVKQLGLANRRLAIELNRTVIRREQWKDTVLRDGDRLEIVHFVGGG